MTLAGPRHELEDVLYLRQKRWPQLTFRLREKDERDVGIWPLAAGANSAAAATARVQVHDTLGIKRASSRSAAWQKYTDNYRQAYLASGQRWTYVRDSSYLVALTILGQVLSCSMVAYAFARIRWLGRELLFVLLLMRMMLPGQVTMIPTVVIFEHLGWYYMPRAVWMPSFFGSAFFIVMLRKFMRSIPTELKEATRIDGCGFFGIY